MKGVMNKFLRRLIPSLKDHLTDDRLASLFCHELSLFESMMSCWHLMTCWQCRLRQQELEGPLADCAINLYRDAHGSRDCQPLFDQARASFVACLQIQLQHTQASTERRFLFPKIPLCRFALMNPVYAVVFALGFFTVLSIFCYRQLRAPHITSNALFVQAESWDAPKSGVSPGVIYQEVRITTSSHQMMDRYLYRDLQRKRKPRHVKIEGNQQKLVSLLAEASVDWDEPLSASGYQSWHDRQPERIDTIARSGSHLIKLTTSVPDGEVASQTLVVRDTDFHPVRRTVAFRHAETVEIAELDYRILPWSRGNDSLFEPLNSYQIVSDMPGRIVSLPVAVSEEQLDEAELSARWMLNQLRADTGEQIELLRGAQSIDVTGVVETEERKRKLQAYLKSISHVTVSLESATDLRKLAAASAAVSIQVASMPEQRNPLAIYLEARGRSVGESNMLARNLFDAALTIGQESRAIAELQKRFGFVSSQSVFAAATLAELMENHRERFASALRQERQLLNDVHATSAEVDLSAGELSLLDGVEKNLVLAKALTESQPGKEIGAEKILAEMSRVAESLREANHSIYLTAKGHTASSQKK